MYTKHLLRIFIAKEKFFRQKYENLSKILETLNQSNIWNNLKKLIQNLISFMQFLVKSQKSNKKKKKHHHQPTHMKMKRFLK